ncbi:rRNA maturation RNase YbeY [Sphingorhabdus sp. IMCC26285]|uniref:Endoribonuclease YbeY n=1 Tax=Sphingorhabdus profundilacus TaxID=2509718 RepID=A0A6I4LY91_9SPHN|nr:rRNA maturation RNase YbeY [Sphingorhabdus profundilacus]MVZ97063.1 rRNA maturation RNase YbeY [Sphingorhabdus profundilacus]
MIDVELDIGLEWRNSGFGQVEVEKAVDAAVKFAGLPGLSDYPSPIEVSIKLSDNDEVHALNREWRDKDKPTNVLSFPTLDDGELNSLRHPELVSGSIAPQRPDGEAAQWTLKQVQGDEPEMELLLGDIILAYGVCEAEAAEKNIPIADHATHLVIHGMLHLLGHDHIEDDDAEAMEALEVKALASMGLPNPYSV